MSYRVDYMYFTYQNITARQTACGDILDELGIDVLNIALWTSNPRPLMLLIDT